MQNHRVTRVRVLLRVIVLTVASPTFAAAAESDQWHYQAYIDAGYAASNRDTPLDGWPGKSSTAVLNSPEIFLAMANVRKDATPDSRWGIEFGLQAGADSEGLITSRRRRPTSRSATLTHSGTSTARTLSYRFVASAASA